MPSPSPARPHRVVAFAVLAALAMVAAVPAGAHAAGVWTAAAPMPTARSALTLTQLQDGRVLAAGGSNRATGIVSPSTAAELFDPATATWTATSPLPAARSGHTATLLSGTGCALQCGKVLVAGGSGLASATLYDPVTGAWAPTGAMSAPRTGHSATLLQSGKVLVAGGRSVGTALATSELYDPATGMWSPADTLADGRSDHSATLLGDGRVLVAGGRNSGLNELAAAEVYDPVIDSWASAGALQVPRSFHSATVLEDGRVLVAGGRAGTPLTMRRSVEIYDPRPGAGGWSEGRSMGSAHASHVAGRLPDGSVVVAGGGILQRAAEIATSERYDPATDTWRYTGSLTEPRSGAAAVVLAGSGCAPRCGRLLAAGGTRQDQAFFGTTDLHDGAAPTQPGTVTDLVATATSATTITLSFSAPASVESFPPPAPRYAIRQSPAPIAGSAAFDAATPLCGGVCAFVPIAIGDRLTLTVTDLQPATTYHFALRALDDASGVGALSNAASATTAGVAVAPGTVSDLQARALSARRAELQFSAPGTGGLAPQPATEYEVRQSSAAIAGDAEYAAARVLCGALCTFAAPETIGAPVRLVVTDLTPGATYYYALRPRDAAGDLGARSNVASVTLPPDRIRPAAVRLLAPRRGARQITLRFRAVASDGRAGPPVRYYAVKQAARPIRTARDFAAASALCRPPGCRFTPRGAGQILTLRVTGLRPGRTYHFAVRPRDDAGNLGPRSRSLRAATRST